MVDAVDTFITFDEQPSNTACTRRGYAAVIGGEMRFGAKVFPRTRCAGDAQAVSTRALQSQAEFTAADNPPR